MSWNDYGVESCGVKTPQRTGKIIGLAGFAQVGKDTVGKILVEQYGFERLSFADALRQGLYDINPKVYSTVELSDLGWWDRIRGRNPLVTIHEVRLQQIVDDMGWDLAKVEYPEIRNLLQKYGTEGGRHIHGDKCWTEIVRRQIVAKPTQDFVITDVRFPNEVSESRDWGAFLMKVTRPGVTSVNGHASDQDLPNDLFNTVLCNDGKIKDLELKLAQILSLAGVLDKQALVAYN